MDTDNKAVPTVITAASFGIVVRKMSTSYCNPQCKHYPIDADHLDHFVYALPGVGPESHL